MYRRFALRNRGPVVWCSCAALPRRGLIVPGYSKACQTVESVARHVDLTGSSAPSAGIQPYKKHNAGDVTNVARAFTRTRVTYSTVLIQLVSGMSTPSWSSTTKAHG